MNFKNLVHSSQEAEQLTCFSTSKNSSTAGENDIDSRKPTYLATSSSCLASLVSVGLIAQKGNVAEKSPENSSGTWKLCLLCFYRVFIVCSCLFSSDL